MPSKIRKRGDGDSVEIVLSGRYKDLLDGTLPIEDLDMEELAQCRLKDKNGRFTGRPPKYLPATIVQRMRREFFERGDKLFETSYAEAVEMMVHIMRYGDEDAVRLKAAQYIVERVRGKTPEVIVVEGAKPWQVLIQEMIVPVGTPAAIEDAEIVDEESEPPRGRRKSV